MSPRGGGAPERPLRRTVSVPDAAAQLGVGTQTLYDHIAKGLIPRVKRGRRVFVTVEWLEGELRGKKVVTRKASS